MNSIFAENLRKLREEKGISQRQLGERMFVNQSTIARWESGSRLPDSAMMIRLADCLGVEAHTLLQLAAQSDESPYIIMVDDNKAILSDGMAVLEEVMPHATIMGFIRPQEMSRGYSRMSYPNFGISLCRESSQDTDYSLCISFKAFFLHIFSATLGSSSSSSL